jgi:hypothetical protein
MTDDSGAARRYKIFGFVAAGHFLFVILVVQLDTSTATRPPDSSPLILLNLGGKPATKPSVAPSAAKPIPISGGRSAPATAAPLLDSPAAQTPPIDWLRESEQAAISQSPAILAEFKRACDEAALRGERRPECGKYHQPDAWVPEPRTFGISGGLPFVRLGKQCVLGLGFFGCGFGKAPEANQHLFDTMRDANRPENSVPDSKGND